MFFLSVIQNPNFFFFFSQLMILKSFSLEIRHSWLYHPYKQHLDVIEVVLLKSLSLCLWRKQEIERGKLFDTGVAFTSTVTNCLPSRIKSSAQLRQLKEQVRHTVPLKYGSYDPKEVCHHHSFPSLHYIIFICLSNSRKPQTKGGFRLDTFGLI